MQLWIIDQLINNGVSESLADDVSVVISLIALLLASWLINSVTRILIVRSLQGLVKKTETNIDDALNDRGVFTRLSHIAPAVVVWLVAPHVFSEMIGWSDALRRIAEIYMLLVCLFAFSALLDAAQDIYRRFDVARRIPIRGYIQIMKMLATTAVGIFVLSKLLDKSPWVFLSGMGALTAIILLVFKDAILGFVAGIQLVANDMVRPGDWVEMSRYGADGNVTEITLTTVKVQNWDQTITTVPTYSLIAESFKNWRGMEESGGRRIKRSIFIDVESIRHCDDELLDRFEQLPRLRDYIRESRETVANYNRENKIPETIAVAGRRLTNIGTFRKYVEAYIRELPEANDEMTFLIRQLQPTDRGLPLEIYFFSRDQRWAHYEALQADIFDHLFAALPYFELRAFQFPTSAAFSNALQAGPAANSE
jgi:miniconductance mechanosensitive channel